MSEPTEADKRRAIQRTGCVRIDGGAFPFCGRHDEDGNPRWDDCRWAGIARLIGDVRAETVTELQRKVERVQWLHDRLAKSPNDRAHYFAGLLRRALEDS